MSEPVSITEELRARIEELTRERDAANAKHETLSALVEGYRRERDNLRSEITKAQDSFDDDGPSGWMPGETAIDALIRTRDEARAEASRRLDELNMVQSQLTRALTARDEARAEADLLRGCNREHVWTWRTDGLTACAMCGVVQRADHANKPCRGVVRVGVRIEDEIASAYRRGAEAMREACAQWIAKREGMSQWVYDDALRALIIPEDKP
jgi:hypothetical protein